MEIFKNKFLVKLIASICLFLTLFNLTGPSTVYAGTDDDDGLGGVLLKPIVHLMTALGDGIVNIIHRVTLEQDQTLIKIEGQSAWEKFLSMLATVLVVIAAVVVTFVLVKAGLAAVAAKVAWLAASKVFAISLVSSGVAGVVTGYLAVGSFFPDDIYLPVYTYSLEGIFSNEIRLFDVNFFSPKEDKVNKNFYAEEIEQEYHNTVHVWSVYRGKMNHNLDNGYPKDKNFKDGIEGTEKICELQWNGTNDLYKDALDWIWNIDKGEIKNVEQYPSMSESVKDMFKEWMVRANDYLEEKGYKRSLDYTDTMFLASPESDPGYTDEIETNVFGVYRLAALEFVAEPETKTTDAVCVTIVFGLKREEIENPTTIKVTEVIHSIDESSARKLAGVVSKWYYILRNLALLVLMLVLIYSGIKIVTGSTAGEKAKHKERLMDWLVAICLIFIMHYIMVFAVTLVDKITNLIDEMSPATSNAIAIRLTDDQYEAIDDIDWSEVTRLTGLGKDDVLVPDSSSESGYSLVWASDFMGLFRVQAQLENEGTESWIGYSFCFVVLVLFTVFFTFTYLKRILYMAFLTMIAPLVAMTYPIDKITDGKAQAFDMWLKEYIFNLMIQPMHLILYSMLVTSAFELATENALYALVALGFMMPAEQLMRKFFGFEKAKTPGLLGGAAGAAIAMSGLQSVMKPKHHGGHDGKNGSNKDQSKVKFANKNSVNTMEAVAGGAPTLGVSGAAGAAKGAAQNVKLKKASNQSYTGAGATATRKQAVGATATRKQAVPSAGGPKTNPIPTSAQTNAARSAHNKKPSVTPNTSNSTNGRGRSALRGGGAFIKGVSKQMAGKVLSGIHPLKWAKNIGLGATLGTAGLLLGVASGDANKAFQYTTAGIAGGRALGNSMSLDNMLDMNQLQEETDMAYYGSEYKDVVVERQREQFQNDKSNINYIRQTMGVSEREAQEILETTGGECFDNGITNIEDIATIHKLTNGQDAISFDQAVAARNYAKKRLPSDPDNMGQEKIKQYKERWEEEYRQAGYANAHDLSEKSFDLAIRYNKALSSLTKNP